MHILIITPGFPQNDNDTSCIPAMQDFILDLITEYPSIKISIVSINYPFKNITYTWKGIKVFSCGGRGRKYPVKIIYLLRAISYFLKINKQLKVNLIHSFWLAESALIGNILSKIFKIRNICTIMGQDALKINNYLKVLNLNNIIKIALSEYHSEYFIKSTGLKPNYIIPWGIKKIISDDNKRPIDIIGVGSLIPLKNYKLFINIVAKLKEEFPSINCLLIGEGIEKFGLNELIKMKNLSNNITLTGQLPREKVLSKMLKSKILLHTSNYESFGLVILEGLAAGCYVVCKNVGIAKESEKIFMIKNIEDCLTTIKKILNMKQEYNSKTPYLIQETVSSYLKLYKLYETIKG